MHVKGRFPVCYVSKEWLLLEVPEQQSSCGSVLSEQTAQLPEVITFVLCCHSNLA